MGKSTSYLEPTGLAPARMDVLAFSVVMIPALAMDTVCCSYIEISFYAGNVGKDPYHDFMKHTSSGIGHLIEFIDTADTTVTEY